jgi:methyl-accepting chemotaxis protein
MARSSDSVFPFAFLRDKTFQAAEIRRVLVLSMFYLFATTLIVGLFYNQIIGDLVEGVAPLFFVSEDMNLVNESVPSLTAVVTKWMLAMLLVNVLITVSLSVYIARKLGQPILAIKRSLKEIGNGNLDVKLRATDKSDFGEISEELQTAMQSVREQIAAAKQEIAQADEQSKASDADKDDMNQAVHNCKMALDFFQVDSANPDQSKAA